MALIELCPGHFERNRDVGVEKVRDYIFSARNGRGGRVLALHLS
jgi:hypothetical protein